MQSRRWVVQTECKLGDILERLAAVGAAEEGRVFVNGRRTTDSAALVDEGADVEVFPARAPDDTGLRIIEQRGGLVVALKPPEMPAEPDRHGSALALTLAVAASIGVRPDRVHAVSRLDVGVSGLVLLAVTAAAQKHAATLQQAGRLERRYLAIAAGLPLAGQGEWTHPVTLGRGKRVDAHTCFRVLAEPVEPGAVVLADRAVAIRLLELRPLTGRTHQLRQHAATAGAPLLGDRRYGGHFRIRRRDGSVEQLSRILLHADRVQLEDEAGVPWTLRSHPGELGAVWAQLGGNIEAFREIGA